MKPLPGKHGRGFTLVEAIVVMVLTAILAGIMVLFIRTPVQSYIDSTGRADLTDVAEIAMRRMAREIRSAVPNSIRFTTSGNASFLEFIPSRAGGRYLATDDGADPSQHPALSFIDANSRQFEVVGPMPQSPYAIGQNDIIIMSNFGTGFPNGDAYAANAPNRAVVSQVNGKIITLVANTFANQVNPLPNKRFIVASTPVTFACVNDQSTGRQRLVRYWGYGFLANQADPSANAQMAVMADNVVGCNFSVVAPANRQAALVGLGIALARVQPGAAANGLETVTLAQQIHVDNTP